MDRGLFVTLMLFSFALLLLYLLFSVLSPFLATLVWAGAIGVITHPIYAGLLGLCRGRENVAAALMTLLVVLALVVPLMGLTLTLSREAALAYQYLENATGGTSAGAMNNFLRHPAVIPWLERIRPLTSSLDLELEIMLLPAVKKGIASILNYSTGIVKNFLAFLIKLVMMLITMFFIYRDGASFMRRFWNVVALGDEMRVTIVETVTRVLGAVMYGIILTCLVQGTLGGLGFWVAGLPSPILFGLLMAICAPIPLVGAALIWLPGAIYLLMQGQTAHGVGLIAWGVLVVSSIDNIIRPLFISGRARLPIPVIVFGVLGGLAAFGITGLVAGPLILALFMLFFEIFPARVSQQGLE